MTIFQVVYIRMRIDKDLEQGGMYSLDDGILLIGFAASSSDFSLQ